jgi:DNA ligase (NAD+)
VTADSPAKRAAKLRELINDYRYNYHVLNKSIMSEAAADSLKHELSQIEAEHPELIISDSPTQRVAGEPLPQFKKIQHSTRMLSLNDVFNEEEFTAWVNRVKKQSGQARA